MRIISFHPNLTAIQISGVGTIIKLVMVSATEIDSRIKFCCVIKLAMLHLKKEGTKLQIIDNSIKFDCPRVLQGPNRWLSGDNRSDLHNLSNPLHISLEWYNPEKSDDLKYIYTRARSELRLTIVTA